MLAKLGSLVYKEAIWRIQTNEKKLFLTFDDGPHPEITGEVLSLLAQYNAKATFFCLAKNVEAFPEVYKQIITRGHSVGNHTYSHPLGWKTPNEVYLDNVKKAAECIKSNLFRPPYGKFTLKQFKLLREDYKCVMWDVLSKDYDVGLSAEHCFKRIQKKAKSGSIIVFHDSEKAKERMLPALKQTLKYFTSNGFEFNSIVL